MKFPELLDLLGGRPVFRSSLLRAGDVDPADVASQLSRWVAAGKLLSLRRGVYAVAAPYRRREPHPFEVANALVQPSYVSLESALSFFGMLPEAVFTATSVTTARAGLYRTPLGDFDFRHVSPSFFAGYSQVQVAQNAQSRAFVARPEKALLDLVYLRPQADDPKFLRQLRLEGLDRLDMPSLVGMAEGFGKPKLIRAAYRIAQMAEEQAEEYEEL